MATASTASGGTRKLSSKPRQTLENIIRSKAEKLERIVGRQRAACGNMLDGKRKQPFNGASLVIHERNAEEKRHSSTKAVAVGTQKKLTITYSIDEGG